MTLARFALAVFGTIAIPVSVIAPAFGAPEGACAAAFAAGIVALIAA